jgi:GNAT superfamily N-acetyltransferase
MQYMIRELLGFDDIRQILPLVQQLNPDVDATTFDTRLHAMLQEGYRCIAAFSDTGVMLGCSGFWVGTRFWCGSFIEPDNVVVDAAHRSHGIGAALVAWIEAEGVKLGCEITKLDAYTIRVKSRDFYKRLGYDEPGVVLLKPLTINKEIWQEQLLAKASA